MWDIFLNEICIGIYKALVNERSHDIESDRSGGRRGRICNNAKSQIVAWEILLKLPRFYRLTLNGLSNRSNRSSEIKQDV